MNTNNQEIYEKNLSHFQVIRRTGNSAQCRCPAHDDKKASLSVTQGQKCTLFKCFAGCELDDILSAAGLEKKDTFYQQAINTDRWKSYIEQREGKRIEAVYHYKSISTGKYAFTKVRLEGKSIKYGILEDDQFKYGLPQDRKTYNAVYGDLNAVKTAIDAGSYVFICEGEKDVNMLIKHGYRAVFTYGSVSDWTFSFTELVKGANVIILADNDEPGHDVAQTIYNDLNGIAKSRTIITPVPDIPKADISDYFQNHTKEDFEKLIADNIKGCEHKGHPLKEPPAGFSIISGAELDTKQIEKPRQVVENLILSGETIIASPPKYGKSWLALDLAISVATGTTFLSRHTNQCEVLYLALEDSESRLQERQRQVLNGRTAPEKLFLTTRSQNLKNGLTEQLDSFLEAHKDCGLIIIDTFQCVRGLSGNQNAYAKDYADAGVLKELADKHRLAIVLIHHTRKFTDSTDPFSNISGTSGISGSADAMIVLSRESRTSKTTKLSFTSRDCESNDFQITFNPVSFRWEMQGTTDQIAQKQAVEVYEGNAIAKTLRKLLHDNPEGYTGTASDIIDKSYYYSCPITCTAQKLGREIERLQDDLYSHDFIVYSTIKNGNGSKRHRFTYGSNPFINTIDTTTTIDTIDYH